MAHQPPAQTTDSGLGYTDEVVGDGPAPRPGQTVTVHYTGWLDDGKQFDSSRDRGTPFSFSIGRGEVIGGWDEGVLTMKVGGRRRLVVPANLGYGEKGAGGVIPPNATLHFDVELLEVKGPSLPAAAKYGLIALGGIVLILLGYLAWTAAG